MGSILVHDEGDVLHRFRTEPLLRHLVGFYSVGSQIKQRCDRKADSNKRSYRKPQGQIFAVGIQKNCGNQRLLVITCTSLLRDHLSRGEQASVSWLSHKTKPANRVHEPNIAHGGGRNSANATTIVAIQQSRNGRCASPAVDNATTVKSGHVLFLKKFHPSFQSSGSEIANYECTYAKSQLQLRSQ